MNCLCLTSLIKRFFRLFTVKLSPKNEHSTLNQRVTSNEIYLFRSSRPEAFCKKGVLRNFAKFTGKHLHQSLFFNKAAHLRPATLLKKRIWQSCFPMTFAKFLRTPFITEHLRWLLLFVRKVRKGTP